MKPAGTTNSVVSRQQQVLCEIASIDDKNFFYSPLILDNLPSYSTIVRRPQCLVTISSLLQINSTSNKVFFNFEEFIVEMFTNCLMYNKRSSPYGRKSIEILEALPSIFHKCGLVYQSRKKEAEKLSEIGYEDEARMLDFVILWREELCAALVSALLLGAVEREGRTPLPGLPTSVECLQCLIISHEFPTFESFLQMVSLMIAFSVGETFDPEAVKCLTEFKWKIDYEIDALWGYPGGVAVDSLLAADRAKQATDLKNIPTENRASYAALRVIDMLSALDTDGVFSMPFLKSDYMHKLPNPMDFHTMRVKATLGEYDFSNEDNTNAVDNEEDMHPLILSSSRTRDALKKDIELMVYNCIEYNGPEAALSQRITQIRRQFAEITRACGLVE
eukprot:Tbor_TRINITY_DN6137_c0_g1::TRINITY_DN6137_c0_g1_i1::g.21966::m.21966